MVFRLAVVGQPIGSYRRSGTVRNRRLFQLSTVPFIRCYHAGYADQRKMQKNTTNLMEHSIIEKIFRGDNDYESCNQTGSGKEDFQNR